MESEYAKNIGDMIDYARTLVGEEAEDVAHDAFLEVMALPQLPDGKISGLFMQRLKWRCADFNRQRGEVLEVELGEVDDDEDGLCPMQLEDLVAEQVHHGGTPPWPTAVDYDSPEEIVNAAQMRDAIAAVCVERCSADDYGMFLAIADGVEQSRVAREWRVDQSTVSRAVARVREVVDEWLAANGHTTP